MYEEINIGFDWDEAWEFVAWETANLPNLLAIAEPACEQRELFFVFDSVKRKQNLYLGSFTFNTGAEGSAMQILGSSNARGTFGIVDRKLGLVPIREDTTAFLIVGEGGLAHARLGDIGLQRSEEKDNVCITPDVGACPSLVRQGQAVRFKGSGLRLF